MSDVIYFRVAGLPPSENHALIQGRGGRRFPSKEYLAWKKKCSSLKNQKIDESEWYEVERVYHFPLYYKNGNIRKKDVSNLNKYCDDELAKVVGIDDSRIKCGHEDKVDCKEGEEYTEWTIYTIG